MVIIKINDKTIELTYEQALKLKEELNLVLKPIPVDMSATAIKGIGGVKA